MMKFITNNYSPLFNLIWLTQIPLFMFVSGFTNINISNYNSIGKYFYKLLKNALILLIPCLSFMIVECLFKQMSLIDGLTNFYYSPNLWFLWALFIIRIIFDFGLYLASKIKNSFSNIFPVIFAMSFSLLIIALMFVFKDKFDFNVLSLKLIAYYIPFYCVGYVFHLILPFLNCHNILSIIISLLCLGILCFECFYFESIMNFDDSSLKFVLIRAVGSISAIVVTMAAANFLVKLAFLSKLSKFGMFSLESYYLHVLFLRMLNFASDDVYLQYLISFGSTALLIAMMIVTLLIMYFIPYLHLIFFGRSFSKYAFEKKLPKIFR